MVNFMKGRKRIPSKIINLRGGASHTHRKQKNEGQSLTPKIPSCPSHLDKEAKKEWKRVSKALYAIGLITELDRGILAAYCESYSRWVAATDNVNVEGMMIECGDGQKLNPCIRVAKEAYDQMVRTGILFGMSPSSRASLSIASQNQTRATDKTELFRSMKHKKGE
jgi:P27 family predicted phage terminase small subunit